MPRNYYGLVTTVVIIVFFIFYLQKKDQSTNNNQTFLRDDFHKELETVLMINNSTHDVALTLSDRYKMVLETRKIFSRNINKLLRENERLRCQFDDRVHLF